VTELEIRDARASDAELFVRLQRSLFPWATEDVEIARAFFTAIEDGTAQDLATFLIAVHGGQFAGYALAQPFSAFVQGRDVLMPGSAVAVVPQLAVVPSLRGRGIGAALLDALQLRLAASSFSVTIAHTRPDLTSWFESKGWTILPENYGFAWIEPPSGKNAELLPPDAPDDVVRIHTPLLHQSPMNAHGYSSIAFRITPSPMRVIAAAYYKATADPVENARLASVALCESLESDPSAFAAVPEPSRVMLYLESLTLGERVEALDRWNQSSAEPE
jgi:GNAT superfamily N-acetyltransferase